MRLATTVAAAATVAAAVATAVDAQMPAPPPMVPPGAGPSIQQKSPNIRPPHAAAKGNTGNMATAGDAGITRGKRLVDSHDCHACHTPMKMGPKGPEPDMSMALSGHPERVVMPPPPKLDGAWAWVGSATNTAFAGPWGITYAINLTPDPDTGMGKWTEQEFINAIKTGKHLGVGRQIMPPMPWPAYRNLSDIALKAIYAYLKSVPPIKNKVPDYVPPK